MDPSGSHLECNSSWEWPCHVNLMLREHPKLQSKLKSGFSAWVWHRYFQECVILQNTCTFCFQSMSFHLFLIHISEYIYWLVWSWENGWGHHDHYLTGSHFHWQHARPIIISFNFILCVMIALLCQFYTQEKVLDNFYQSDFGQGKERPLKLKVNESLNNRISYQEERTGAGAWGPNFCLDPRHTERVGTQSTMGCFLVDWKRQEVVLLAKELRTQTNFILHEDQERYYRRKSYYPRFECLLKSYFPVFFRRAIIEDGWTFPLCDSFTWWIGGMCLRPPSTHTTWKLHTHIHQISSSLDNLEALSGLGPTWL